MSMLPKEDVLKIEIRDRSWTRKMGSVEIPMKMSEVFIDDKELDMGEGGASIDSYTCPRHGEISHIGGYNQGGHDGMSVCIKCVVEVHKHLETQNAGS